VLSDSAIILGDNLDVLPRFEDETFQLIYIDPPLQHRRRADAQDAPDSA
jgi:predicted methyltransferase